jgi:hypothetical protein
MAAAAAVMVAAAVVAVAAAVIAGGMMIARLGATDSKAFSNLYPFLRSTSQPRSDPAGFFCLW